MLIACYVKEFIDFIITIKFRSISENVGYNTLGHNIDDKDLIPILNAYRNRDSENLISKGQGINLHLYGLRDVP